MELIYQNFDGLDVTFQGSLPEQILHELEMARQSAERNFAPVEAKLGNNEITVLVAESGMKGGYRYRFDTGLDGEVWFVANSNDPIKYNIRVSIKSLSLALYGYAGVKKRVLGLIKQLNAFGPETINVQTGEVESLPIAHISRVDYCFDFKSEEFQIEPKYIIAHSRFKKQKLETIEMGRNVMYCRVGSMPNKQIVLYDKIREIQEKNKSYWWDIWGIKKEDFEQKIWRIEVRAGKKELKAWNLRNFDDFEMKIGDVILSILKDIKYVSPNLNDTNINRWPMAQFWKIAQKSAKRTLAGYICNADKSKIIREYRDKIIERYEKQITGMLPAYSVAKGKDEAAQLPGVMEGLFRKYSEASQKEKKFEIERKIKKAKNKFVFLNSK